MSLIISHLRLISAPAWPLSIGLLLNSAILFGNVGTGLTGPVPIIKERLGSTGLNKKDKLRIFSLWLKRAGSLIVPATFGSTALHLLSAYLTPSRRIRNSSLFAAASAISIIPYTFVLILPTNKILMAMDQRTELTPAEEADLGYLLDKWEDRHKVRYIAYVLSWTSSLAGLMGVVGRW